MPKRLCARGQQCVEYPRLDQPQPVRRTSESPICEQCTRAERDADFEAEQRGPSITYRPISYKGNPRKGQLECLKRNLVAQMIAQRGRYWKAVEEVRARWQIAPLAELPPASEGLLYPPSVAESKPYEELYALYLRVVGPGASKDPYTLYLTLKRRWQNALLYVLHQGDVPDKYLGDGPPYVDKPPFSKRRLPWYRFAAACVLYEPPRSEEAFTFAEYGGLPPLPPFAGETKEEPIVGVLTERQMRERDASIAEQSAFEEMVSRKMWELRWELDDLDYDRARYTVIDRFLAELDAEYERVRELHEFEMDLNPPHRYYIEFDPEETKDKDVLNTLMAIRAREEQATQGGRRRGDILTPVLCAILLNKPGWSIDRLAGWLELEPKTVEEKVNQGRKFLTADS